MDALTFVAVCWAYLAVGFVVLIAVHRRLPESRSQFGAGVVMLLAWPVVVLRALWFRKRLARRGVRRA